MSDHDTSPLHPEADDLLQAALSDPFSVPPNLSRVSPSHPASQPPSEPAAAAAAVPGATPPSSSSLSSSSVSVSASEQEAWRTEYEAQVVEWRKQSADVRTRAEAERARREERRARERGEGVPAAGRREVPARADTSTSVGTSEWEAVSRRSESIPASSSTAATASSKDPVADAAHSQAQASHPPSVPQNQPGTTSSNAPAKRPAPSANSGPPPAVAAATRDPTESPQWENLPSSPTSSFPSMSFPEPSRTHSPEQHLSHAPPATTAATGDTTPAANRAMAASMTLAVFDNTLPVSTRFWSLVSSLSINMLLPFVNGVMLGFGEIFAKTVIVGWLGWGPTVATNLGLGIPSRSRR